MKAWYSIHHINQTYVGDEPAFFNPADFSWSEKLTDASAGIRKELHARIADGHELPRYFNKAAYGDTGKWKASAMLWWGVSFFKERKKYPQTWKAVQDIPGLLSVSFSLLEPGGCIAPHHGDTNAIVRVHLGLIVPSKLPLAGFKVNGEDRSWEEDGLLVFCDAHLHEAWNHTGYDRYILILDVIRPEFKQKKHVICAKVVGGLFLQKLAGIMPFLARAPQWFINAMHTIAWLNAYWLIPVRNALLSVFY